MFIQAAFSQPKPGMLISFGSEAGRNFYLVEGGRTASDVTLSSWLGLDLEVRGTRGFAFLIGASGGLRGYEERYSLSAVDYVVQHQSVDIHARFQIVHSVGCSPNGFWEFGYGVLYMREHSSDLQISTNAGHNLEIEAVEPRAFGLRTSISRGWGRTRPLRIGLTVNIVAAGARTDVYVPWRPQQPLGNGLSRVFTGLTVSFGLVRMPWQQGTS